MNKWIARILTLMFIAGTLTGCEIKSASKASSEEVVQTVAAESPSKVFTDSTGRKITVPARITKVAITGPLAQMVLFALAPDMLAGIASKWDDAARPYIDDPYEELPELGQLYGGKGELNLETLLNSGAQVVIDVGESKSGIEADLNALQEKTGIPFIHIEANLDNMGDAYRMLGVLLDRQQEAETLAVYCEKTYAHTKTIANQVEKVSLLYCSGEKGLNVIAKGSYHAQVIDLLSDNAAVVDQPISKGTGNEVDMEQIMIWNPDVIFFAPGSIYESVKTDDAWNKLDAIKKGRFYEVPEGPYNWMGFPPSVQRYLGMMWMAKVLYPEKADYDLYSVTAEYFQLFYHWDLSREAYEKLVKDAIK